MRKSAVDLPRPEATWYTQIECTTQNNLTSNAYVYIWFYITEKLNIFEEIYYT